MRAFRDFEAGAEEKASHDKRARAGRQYEQEETLANPVNFAVLYGVRCKFDIRHVSNYPSKETILRKI